MQTSNRRTGRRGKGMEAQTMGDKACPSDEPVYISSAACVVIGGEGSV